MQWATDNVLLCTTELLTVDQHGHCIITDVDYNKLSGRKYKLDHILFHYLGPLDFGHHSGDAAIWLLNQERQMDRRDTSDRSAPMRITALNAMISKLLSGKDALIPVGPNKFFVKSYSAPIDNLLHLSHGYFTSIRPRQDRVLLNINVATSAFLNAIPLDHVFNNCTSSHAQAQALLKGLTVWISYWREPHDDECYPNVPGHWHPIVAGFGETPDKQEFESNGQRITVAKYFADLGHHVRHPRLRCTSVNVASPKLHATDNDDTETGKTFKPSPQWIPPELLYIDPYQPYGKLLPPDLTDKTIKQAVRQPSVNQNKIISEGFRLLGIESDSSTIRSLGLDVGHRLLKLPAVLLPAPSIRYRNNSTKTANIASWNLTNVQLLTEPRASPAISYSLDQAVLAIDLRSRWGADRQNLGIEMSLQMKQHGIKFDTKVVLDVKDKKARKLRNARTSTSPILILTMMSPSTMSSRRPSKVFQPESPA